MGSGGRKAKRKQFITDEDGTLLRDKERIRKRSGGFFQTLLNKRSPKLDLTIAVLLPQLPLAPTLGVGPTNDDMMWGNPEYAELESGRTRLPPS